MAEHSPLFDAVIFDLDGTLVATDRFWVQAARTGTRRALNELGLDRPVPTAQDWMGIVGRPADEAFASLFADLEPAARAAVQKACHEEEQRLLEAGGAALMPGAEDLLRKLVEDGVSLGIASNCTRRYLDHMLDTFGLRRLVREARCVDSPGVASKADMIEQILVSLDTRRAVMVGDRSLDRDAAWENGLPHVHCAFGFAPRGEEVAAEATIEDLGELPGRLDGRRRWVDQALESAGVFRPTLRPPWVLGIDGPPAAGKTLFAHDVVEVLRRRNRAAGVVSLDAFRRAPRRGADGELRDPLGETFDVDALFAEVLEPAARGEPVRFDRTSSDRLGLPVDHRAEVPGGSILVLEGPHLTDPRLRVRVDRLIRLQVPEEAVLRRVAGREGRAYGPRSLERVRGTELPTHRAFDQRYDPALHADLVLDATNPLGDLKERALRG